jgi:hypothetical protein
VVDVHARIAGTTLKYQVDELFECHLLFGRGKRPERFVVRSVGVADGVAEEVIEATVLGQPIPFEIEEDVECRWNW